MSERFLAVDAASVRAQIENLKAQYPELEEDSGLFTDVLEGETNLFEIIAEAVDLKLDADEMADAIKARIDSLSARKKRFETKSDAMKAIIQGLMTSADQHKVVLPAATISVTAGRERAVVTNVDELAQGFYRTERKPVLDEITKALKAGETVPGAVLEAGKPSIAIRTK